LDNSTTSGKGLIYHGVKKSGLHSVTNTNNENYCIKHILINLGIWLNSRLTDQKTITEDEKVKKGQFPEKLALFWLWLPGRDSLQNSFGYHFDFLMTPIKKNLPKISYMQTLLL